MRMVLPPLLLTVSSACLYIDEAAHRDQLDSRQDPCTPVAWYADTDQDGFGDGAVSTEACTPPDGHVADNTDCDDADDEVYPGATEVCDGDDEDCDNVVDNGALLTFYPDTDNDGYGNPDAPVQACGLEAGTVADGTDCNDGDADIHPGVPDDDCDGVDDNCSGTADSEPPTWFLDFDGDTYGTASDSVEQCQQPPGYVGNGDDCDDTLFAVNPDGAETCDGVDQDCDGAIDEEASDRVPFYLDVDADSFGDADDPGILACEHPSRVTDNTDCDDGDATAFPGNPDVCHDGVDNDCDGQVPEACTWPDELDPGAAAAASLYGSGSADFFGKRFLWIDANHDGHDELVLGAEKFDAGGVVNTGAVLVYEADALMGDLDASAADRMVVGEFNSHGFGGDLQDLSDADGDGFDDWLVGNAVYNHNLGIIDREWYVFRSAVTGDSVSSSADLVLTHPESTALTGSALAAGGDITGDGVPDLILGVAGHDDVTSNEGAVFVISADASGTLDVTTGQTWTHSVHETALAGGELATADFDGDGILDVLVASPQRFHTGNNADGVVFLVETPNSADLDLADASWWHGRAYGHFGRDLGRHIGDVDGDGHDDVLIGAEQTQVGAVRGGEAYLMLGPVDTAAASGGRDVRDFAAATFTGTVEGAEAGNEIQVLGDIDGDGTLDIGVSAPLYDDASDGTTLAGAVYLALGPHAGATSLEPGPGITLMHGGDGERLGLTLVPIGDLNQDGVDDFAVSSLSDVEPLTGSSHDAGSVLVFYGRAGW